MGVGTFPEYLGAIGTICAVGAALWIARRDGKRFEDEQEAAINDRKEAARERAEAARDRELYRQEVETERDERQRRVAGRVTLAFGSRSTVSAGLNRNSNPSKGPLSHSHKCERLSNISPFTVPQGGQ